MTRILKITLRAKTCWDAFRDVGTDPTGRGGTPERPN